MSDVTRILAHIDSGDPRAAEQLLPLVYDELRKLAAAKLAHEQPGQTLQATALVHEAYMRLVAKPGVGSQESGVGRSSEKHSPTPDPRSPTPLTFNSRGHFFAAAAEAMRRILVDRARRRNSLKRGGGARREPLSESALTIDPPLDELLAVHDVLDRLAEIDPPAAMLVKLRFFAGLNWNEVAQAMGISVRSAHDIWTYARTWLHQNIGSD